MSTEYMANDGPSPKEIVYGKDIEIPKFVFEDRRIPAGAKVYYGMLCLLINSDGVLSYTDEQLEELPGMSEGKVTRYNKALGDNGYITRKVTNIPYRNDEGKFLWKKHREMHVRTSPNGSDNEKRRDWV